MRIVVLFPTVEEAKGFLLSEPHVPVFISGRGGSRAGGRRAERPRETEWRIGRTDRRIGAAERSAPNIRPPRRTAAGGMPERYTIPGLPARNRQRISILYKSL